MHTKFWHSFADDAIMTFISHAANLILGCDLLDLNFLIFKLHTVPFITIDDDRGISTPEKFYRVGSTIELKCIVDRTPHRANYISWKHGIRTLNYDTSRGGIR